MTVGVFPCGGRVVGKGGLRSGSGLVSIKGLTSLRVGTIIRRFGSVSEEEKVVSGPGVPPLGRCCLHAHINLCTLC